MNLLEQATQPRVPSYREIPLTRGMVALVDATDYEWLIRHKWHAQRGAHTWYAVRDVWASNTHTVVLMHREILSFPPRVDHEDTNGLHNWRDNLRTANRSQNLANRPKQANNTSGFKGVCWHARAHKWVAQIQHEGRHVYLGLRDTKDAAHDLYCEAARERFGEFARME